MSFDPLVSNSGRLEILAALAERGRQDFVELRRATQLTDGNLASHAKRLSTAGLIQIEKQFRARKPVTSFRITSAGRGALEAHVRRLVSVIGVSPAVVAGATSDSADEWVD